MKIAYEMAPDVEAIALRIIRALSLKHIDENRLHFYRSKGSKAKRVQARIHGMGRIWFDALHMNPHYIIEVISEEYDRLDDREKEKVVIHELMHIPAGFSGGFVPHKGRINKKTVEKLYRSYVDAISNWQVNSVPSPSKSKE
ncbi:MAG: putative metallopeptidase [Nitrososphaerales archaeon]